MKVSMINCTAIGNGGHAVSVCGDVDLEAEGFFAAHNGGDAFHFEQVTPAPEPPKKGRFGRFLSSVGQGALGGALGNMISGG